MAVTRRGDQMAVKVTSEPSRLDRPSYQPSSYSPSRLFTVSPQLWVPVTLQPRKSKPLRKKRLLASKRSSKLTSISK